MTNSWRIPEKVLIIPAFLLGSIGAGIGMFLFWHKIKKPLFIILIPLAFVLNIVIIAMIRKRHIHVQG